jgi:hypothetical protein
MKEAAMKKLSTGALPFLWLLFSLGCSSIPQGTHKIEDIMANASERLGQEVIVVGTAEMRTSMATFGLFKVYQKSDYIWVTLPEGTEDPPQGIKIRVTGTLQEKEFNIIGKVFYIEATKVLME